MLSITANDIHVEFPIYDTYARSLRHQLGLGRIATNLARRKTEKFMVGGEINTDQSGKVVIKALDGVSFDIREGDRVGLLGHNGSGKTTLLRTIAGIYEPVRGTISIHGRATPLFDLMLGMDQDATGMENIWLRGKMLDFTNRQITESLDDIAEFTELGNYLYMPIRTYSTGMILRLAFGISTAITPDILILDEMIGAGDAGFVERAQARMGNFMKKTGILVIATHSTGTLKEWCNKGMVLAHGKVVAQGAIDEVIKHYEHMVAV